MSTVASEVRNLAPQPGVDAGLECLVMLARFHGVALDPMQIRHEFALGFNPANEVILLAIAKRAGLKARSFKSSIDRIESIALPVIAKGVNGSAFIIAAIDKAVTGGKALIQDPTQPAPESLTFEQLASRWDGQVIAITPRGISARGMRKFDFTWFIPALVKHRKLIGEVLIASFFVQMVALVTPLFFQVVMDKVLVNQAISTLTIVCLGLLIVSVFGFLLSALRTYSFSHTASRIDAELGASLFRHLLALPQAYFEARRAGDSIARVRELENIRQFLTGNSVTVVLDLFFSVAFLAVMLYYSTTLTIIVLVSIPVYVALTVLITPVLRQRLEVKFQRSAENQAFLVEAVSSIQTVKANALEPQLVKRWEQQLAAYISSGFQVTKLAAWASESVQLVNKLVTVATLYFGAQQVIAGNLTVGQLVAFNMLASQFAQPIMRLAQLWQDFQQAAISVERLADILDTPSEVGGGSKSTLPKIRGDVFLDAVRFRYRPDGVDVLRNVSLQIQAGETVGIVGRSGSGKSTLAKLIQRLYIPQVGRVSVDGLDLAQVDTASLRRQIGVVLQENRLFANSVRDNIAAADPGMPLEAIIAAAKLAGAHDFIGELAQGYDTFVGEQGLSLSGGQRQRIALARALVTNPRVLILDEATSALDYESEQIIQSNMQKISSGRTVIIIAHRLSAVRTANRIIVMDRGEIVEMGNHDQLLKIPNGRYTSLYAIQSGYSAGPGQAS
jgi:ATP-binding cassette, subfamily B, bacterial HlyB/CyaB